LVVATAGGLLAIPTAVEIPSSWVSSHAGFSPLVTGAPRISLRALSLPSMVRAGRTLSLLVTAAVCLGDGVVLTAGGVMLGLGA
jgi:hypothetical protein